MNGETHTATARVWDITIGEAVDILHIEDVEDVMQTDDALNIGTVLIHEFVWIIPPGRIVERRYILLREIAPQHTDGEILLEAGTFEEGYGTHEITVGLPREHQLGVAVIDELTVADKREIIIVNDVRQVGSRREEQGVRHLVPHCTCLEGRFPDAPVAKKPAFIYFHLGEMVEVFTAQETVDAPLMGDADGGSIAVDRYLSVGKVVVASRGTVFHLKVCLAGAQPVKAMRSGGAVTLKTHAYAIGETDFLIALKHDALLVVEHTVKVTRPAERAEEVVMVALIRALTDGAEIPARLQDDITTRIFVCLILLVNERVCGASEVIEMFALKAIGSIAGKEKPSMKPRCSATTEAQPQTVDIIARDKGAGGSNNEF